MASARRKPRKVNRQPEVGRLFSRVDKFRLDRRSISQKVRDSRGRFIKAHTRPVQKRDKYGRFVKVNKLGIAKRNPRRLRDEHGRFISQDAQRKIYRDKRGRFTKARPPWHRRRSVLALPIFLGITGAVYFGLQLNKPIVIEEPVAASPLQATQEEPDISKVVVTYPESEPIRLKIPKIGVNTSFVEITKKADGTIETPSSPYKVGWYNKAPTPGELGPAIVVGHVDRPGGTAVFWRLRELVPGDTFEIDRKDGSTLKFKVDKVKKFPQSDFPTEEVYGNLDYAGVRLITCTGTFNRTIHRYSDNLVVYASLVVENND